jgi:hypothetical protein
MNSTKIKSDESSCNIAEKEEIVWILYVERIIEVFYDKEKDRWSVVNGKKERIQERQSIRLSSHWSLDNWIDLFSIMADHS